MSLININLDDAKDLGAVPDGEYLIKVVSAELMTSKKGAPMISLLMQVESEPTADLVSHWLMLPTDADDDVTKNRKLLAVKTALAALDYDASGGIDTDELKGLQAKAILKTVHDDEYGDQNRIRKFVA